MAERDKQGRSLKATLTGQEYKRLDALFQAKAILNEMSQALRLLDKFVADARKNGATWVEIGEATGMSAQSAHHRWSKNGVKAQAQRVPSKKAPRVPVRREVQERLAV
jgi:hypothetical protein